MIQHPIIWLLSTILGIVKWVIIIEVIMSWLVAFNVINTRNEFVGRVVYFLKQVSEPILRPIRRIMPPLGGLDLSPLIAIIGIQFLQYCLFWFDINYLR